MRDLNLEAAIWDFFTSPAFFQAAAQECENTMEWFGTLAVGRQVADFGRNNQIFDRFKQRAREFRRGAELAKLGDYKFLWEISDAIRGDARGFMEQALHSWMTEAEEKEFSNVRLSRLLAYSSQITRALNNAMVGADSFFDRDPECPERSDDDGFPGDEIVRVYESYANYFGAGFWELPTPLPEYRIDPTISCQTGDAVPRTGVWYPDTGLERHSLAFAIKGLRMQPVYRITKTREELKAEGVALPAPETVAVATTWHPVIPFDPSVRGDADLMSKAGQPCPKSGVWQAADMSALERTFKIGDPMPSLGSAYGVTVWRWVRDR